jgi:N-acetylglucosamine malate deacetylase 1
MKILIVSAHPDDEAIGAGGTLLKHKAFGDDIYWVIITHVFKNQGYSANRIKDRESEINKVSKLLGVKKTFNLGFPTTSLSYSVVPKLITQVTEIIKKTEPEVIYLPNRSDAHSDHRITFDAIMACTKSFRHDYIKRILMYECLSETEFAPALAENAFIPNWFVDISGFFKQKINLAKVYSSELGAHPFPRSLKNLEALAIHRGATAGTEYAEAFQLLKFIDK